MVKYERRWQYENKNIKTGRAVHLLITCQDSCAIPNTHTVWVHLLDKPSESTHTHTELAPYQCTPEDLMAFRARPSYYGHLPSTFTVGGLRGLNLFPASFRKFKEALNREMRWMIFSPHFYVSMEHFTVICFHSILPSPGIWLQLAG